MDSKGQALVLDDEGVWTVGVADLAQRIIEDPPSWLADIEPLLKDACAACHGKAAYAHPMYERETWIDEIDEIIYMVSEPPGEPQMPLPPNPPLAKEDVEAIMEWRDAGFPE